MATSAYFSSSKMLRRLHEGPLRPRYLLVSIGLSRAHGARRPEARGAVEGDIMKARPILPALIEQFFTERLMRQRNVSPHTIASYRDTFRLLFAF
jgi:hypothetical protein